MRFHRFASLFAAAAAMTVLCASPSQAQVTVKPSPDNPAGTGHVNMDLKTLLTDSGITSDFSADQLPSSYFTPLPGKQAQIEVLFDAPTRDAAAGYYPNHIIGYYDFMGNGVAPAPGAVTPVVNDLSPQGTTFVVGTPNTFGLQLTSPGKNNTPIYSDDLLNVAGFRNILFLQERDGMGAIVPSSFIIGWEDLLGGGDEDYQDITLRVKFVTLTPVNPVPEPGAYATFAVMLGGTAFGLVAARRKKLA